MSLIYQGVPWGNSTIYILPWGNLSTDLSRSALRELTMIYYGVPPGNYVADISRSALRELHHIYYALRELFYWCITECPEGTTNILWGALRELCRWYIKECPEGTPPYILCPEGNFLLIYQECNWYITGCPEGTFFTDITGCFEGILLLITWGKLAMIYHGVTWGNLTTDILGSALRELYQWYVIMGCPEGTLLLIYYRVPWYIIELPGKLYQWYIMECPERTTNGMECPLPYISQLIRNMPFRTNVNSLREPSYTS